MKSYELTFLALSNISEDELKTAQENIISFIKDRGGEHQELRGPIKRELSYSLRKKSGGNFFALNFCLNPDALMDFEKKLKSESKILRYVIIVKKPEAKVIKRRRAIKTPRAIIEKGEKSKVLTHKEGQAKVELQEIEKKLEEILGE